jgi:hypothetical protein
MHGPIIRGKLIRKAGPGLIESGLMTKIAPVTNRTLKVEKMAPSAVVIFIHVHGIVSLGPYSATLCPCLIIHFEYKIFFI